MPIKKGSSGGRRIVDDLASIVKDARDASQGKHSRTSGRAGVPLSFPGPRNQQPMPRTNDTKSPEQIALEERLREAGIDLSSVTPQEMDQLLGVSSGIPIGPALTRIRAGMNPNRPGAGPQNQPDSLGASGSPGGRGGFPSVFGQGSPINIGGTQDQPPGSNLNLGGSVTNNPVTNSPPVTTNPTQTPNPTQPDQPGATPNNQGTFNPDALNNALSNLPIFSDLQSQLGNLSDRFSNLQSNLPTDTTLTNDQVLDIVGPIPTVDDISQQILPQISPVLDEQGQRIGSINEDLLDISGQLPQLRDVLNQQNERIGTLNQDLLNLPDIQIDDQGNLVIGGDVWTPPAAGGGTGGTGTGNGTGGTSGGGPGRDDDGGFSIDDLLRLPIFGGDGGGEPPIGDGPMSDGGIIDLIFGGGGETSQSLSNVLGDIGNTVINAGFNQLAADTFRDANRDALEFANQVLERSEPFRQLGIRNIDQLQAAARTNPELLDLFEGQLQSDPTTNVQLNTQGLQGVDPTTNVGLNLQGLQGVDPTTNVDFSAQGLPELTTGDLPVGVPQAQEVDVNQINPFDTNDPALRFILDQGTRAIEGSAAARGKLLSGGTLEELQNLGQGAALNRAQELTDIGRVRDATSLAANQQRFGQEAGQNQFANLLNQQELENLFGIRGQLFGERGATAEFDLGQQQQNILNQLGLRGQQFGERTTAADFDLGQQQQNILNQLGLRGQQFGERAATAGFDLGQQQQNIGNIFDRNQQLFGQRATANEQAQGADINAFNQLASLVNTGQSSAVSQGAQGTSQLNQIAPIFQQQGASRVAQMAGLAGSLGNIFGGGGFPGATPPFWPGI